jgi:catechol 2,3-dioxygenase-like lactoylglutathione lyase family enzyme
VRKVSKHDEPTTPESATPESATPESATPESATPESATPESATPESATPELAPLAAQTSVAPPAAVSAPEGGSAPVAAIFTPSTPAPPAAGRRQGGAWVDLPATPEPDEHAGDLITAYPSARPGPAGAIHGVGITILVTDLDRSVAFYRDTLGFHEIDHGDGSAVLASGDTRLVLRTVLGLSAEAGRLIYLNLEVGDVEAIYNELLAKGVPFVHPPQTVNRGERLELWSATFRDPDDHNIAITQWRAIR